MSTSFVPPRPDQWEGPAPQFTPPPVSSWEGPASSGIEKPKGSAAGRFFGGLWDTTVGGLGSAAKMVADLAQSGAGGGHQITPETQRALKGIIDAHADQAQ